MKLAKAISEAQSRELFDLAHYIAGELEMEGVDVGERDHHDIHPDAIVAAIKAWVYTQQNTRDGDA